jgi:hypothetical protein
MSKIGVHDHWYIYVFWWPGSVPRVVYALHLLADMPGVRQLADSRGDCGVERVDSAGHPLNCDLAQDFEQRELTTFFRGDTPKLFLGLSCWVSADGCSLRIGGY